jgi:hypothetical protein
MSQDNQILSNEAPKASRRSILTAAPAVAVAVLAGGTVANAVALAIPRTDEVDPIFAAIERERQAYAEYCVTAAFQRSANDQCPPEVKAAKNRRAHPAFAAWWAQYQEAAAVHEKSAQELWSAREAFLETQPTSVAGLIAFIDHIEGPFSSGPAGEAFWDDSERELAFPTLAAAVRDLIAGRPA